MVTSHSSLLKSIQFAVVIIILSIVGVLVVTKGKSSAEVRTKAAQEVRTVKQWTFDSSTEGWIPSGIPNKSDSVKTGVYELPFQAWDKLPVCPPGNKPCPMAHPREYTPSVKNTVVKSILKYPVNMVRVRLSVTPDSGNSLAPFYLQLDQIISGKPYYGVKKIENIIADGKEHEYRFRFPEDTNLKSLDMLQLSFYQLGKYSGGKIRISDIALLGMNSALEGNKTSVTKQNSTVSPKSSISACPEVPAFTASVPIEAYQFTYPSVIKSMDDSTWLMVTGGIISLMPESIRSQVPGGASHIRFAGSQEELWISESKDLISWSKPRFTFNILPETQVAFKDNKQYREIYPNAFKSGCAELPGGSCNVQINDPSIVKFNGSLYMYFTILENYRWYDKTISLSDTAERNRHSIGLAVSNDDGKHWAFVDKIIPEQTTDTAGQVVIGAWAPSAIVDGDLVDVYFHDAFGTKQYVAQLVKGVSIKQIERLNKNDSNYRVNVDVVRNSSGYEMLYNDEHFNIVRTMFSSPTEFGNRCPETVVVKSNNTSKWPTPHQIIDNGKVHLFFWEMGNPTYNHHWIRSY